MKRCSVYGHAYHVVSRCVRRAFLCGSDQDNKNYVSNEGGLTAFKLSKSNEIYREGEFAYLRENSLLLTKQTNAVVLTLEELKLKVMEILEDE